MTETTPKGEPRLKCIYGNKVKLQNLVTNEMFQYTLVTYTEEKLAENKISNYTRVGRAIWTKEEGAIVKIDISGKGVQDYKIVEIDHAD